VATSARPQKTERLCDLKAGQEADFFALLTLKEELTTRDGKAYHRVGFRDAGREVQFPIWADSPWAADCRERWKAGEFYKLRAIYRETQYGGQLEIRKIRLASDADAADGFDPMMLVARSREAPGELLARWVELAEKKIVDQGVRQVVLNIAAAHRERLLAWPAGLRNHHAYVGGFLEHSLRVATTTVQLAERYAEHYPEMQPPLDADLAIAGALLHDIGKLVEVDQHPTGATRSVRGQLLGHVVLGRDLLREAAAGTGIDDEKLLRLEHILVSHERDPATGAVRPAMTAEALVVQFADEFDTKFDILARTLAETASGRFTSAKNLLHTELYRGGGLTEAKSKGS
jgi:3'-5' exoribonuclease